jgi:predicted ATP-grasp superfamily ATP-dependent carboligase
VHLIVALSARALAQMAERSVVPAVTLDAFADDDTTAAALDAQRAAVTDDFRFEPEPLVGSVKALARHFGATASVLGSGFESSPELIDAIDRVAPVAGNRASTVRMLKDPHALARLLGRLGIPHPETRSALPEDGRGWLVKRGGRAGGWHVRRAAETTVLATDEYVQRQVDGELVSIVFLADGKHARVVGANRFWTGVGGPLCEVDAKRSGQRSAADSPYTFSGAVDVPPSSVAQIDEMRDAVDALVRASGLVGLNGIDCIVTAERWWLIEVNPRPTSTAELHDRGWPGGLFSAHLDACGGSLRAGRAAPPNMRAGLQIVYAGDGGRLPQHLAWPDWVTDRPRPDGVIASGEPLCTVHALAQDEATVRRKLAERADQVCRLLAPATA